MNNPKTYSSFEEFERSEINRIDSLYSAIDDIVDELFLEGLDAHRAEEELDFSGF